MYIAITIGAIFIFVVIVALCIISISKNYNKLVKLQSIVKESYSTLEVFIDKRYEIVSKMANYFRIEDIKKPEIATILNIIMQLKNNHDSLKKFSLEANLTVALDNAENTLNKVHQENADYVQLVLNCNFVQDDLKRARNYYNNNVEAYNKKLNTFPSSVAARLFKFKKEFYVK